MQELGPLPPRRSRKTSSGIARQPAPRRRRRALPVLLALLALAALAVTLVDRPDLLARAAALITPVNLQYLGLGVAGLAGLAILRRVLAALARRRVQPPARRPVESEPPPGEAPVGERAPGAAEQILSALILFISSGVVIGAVLYLEMQWYFDAAPYRFLGLAGLAGVALLGVVFRAARGRRRRNAAADDDAVPFDPPWREPSAAAREVAAACEPAPRRGEGNPAPARAEVEAAPPAPPEQPAQTVTFPSPGLVFRPGRIGVGLDVGTSHIKLVQVRGTRKGPVVTCFGMAPTPRQAIVEGVVTKPQEVAAAIRGLMAEIGLTHRRVVSVVGGQGVILRHAEFPRMGEQQLREVLRWEAEQYIPMPSGEAVSDFMILEDGPPADKESKDPPKMKVLLVGTQQKVVQSILDTLRAAALYPVAIDVDALAHLRVLTANGYFSAQPGNLSSLVVDIGASSTKLSVLKGGVPQLNRTIAAAGNGLTAAVAQGLGQDTATAERTKRELGASPESSIARYVQPLVDELLLEVRRSIEFYLARDYGEDIKFIYLVGGGAMLKELPEALADYLNASLTERARGTPDITVLRVEPLREIGVHSSLGEQLAYFGPQFAGALGLALREGG
ncbi:MAG: type IV pilus assembly protein PilM [bacterium]|nr:type IV pilus assembly protein PilM [bacterium]